MELSWHQEQSMRRTGAAAISGRDVPHGYRACDCCGTTGIGPLDGEPYTCEGCDPDTENPCDPAETWHCFTGYCDGSGCTYEGECER